MPKPQRVPDLMQGDPFDHLWVIRGLPPGRWSFGADQDVGAVLCTTNRKACEDRSAGMRDEMNDDIRFLRIFDRPGHICERDQAIEAVEEYITPGLDCAVKGCELFVGGTWVGLHGNGQVGVVPPVARIIVA